MTNDKLGYKIWFDIPKCQYDIFIIVLKILVN